MKDNINSFLNLAKEKFLSKEYDKAIDYLEKIILIEKNNLPALVFMGDILVHKKLYLNAIKIFDDILKIDPKMYFIYNNKGFCLLSLNRIEEAKNNFERCIILKKDFAHAYNNYGITLKKIGNYEEAKNNFLKAIKYENNFFHAYNNLGSIQLETNDLDSAIKNFKKSIELNSTNKEAYNNLGLVYKKKKDFESSVNFLNKSLSLDANYLDPLTNLAAIYIEKGDYDKSLKYYEKILSIDPNNLDNLSNLIHLKLIICDWKDLDILEKKLFVLNNKNTNNPIQPYQSLLIEESCELQKKIAEKWCKKFPKKKINKFVPYNNEKIRLGYFSSDFKDHAIALLVKNLFKNHNKNKFELFGFNLGAFSFNEIEKDIITNFKDFIDCNLKSDDEILKICKNLKIDIAIDINGHTKYNRFKIFKYRCAPVQINYLGYPGTLGDEIVDYIVADKTLIPENYAKNYSEKIIYLPDTYQPNSLENLKLDNVLDKAQFNLPEDKFIFCCFNNSFKINEYIFNIWIEILKFSNDSVLWLLSSNPTQNKNILNEVKKKNIDVSRIIFADRIEYSKHLERFKLADLFLDTYPYGGHTTSIESLATGLPILTYIGETFSSRVTSSFLSNLSLDELITKKKDEYIKLAVELSKNKEKIKKLKHKINQQKEISNIFNNKIYTLNLEKAYLKVYENFINNKDRSNVYID